MRINQYTQMNQNTLGNKARRQHNIIFSVDRRQTVSEKYCLVQK